MNNTKQVSLQELQITFSRQLFEMQAVFNRLCDSAEETITALQNALRAAQSRVPDQEPPK